MYNIFSIKTLPFLCLQKPASKTRNRFFLLFGLGLFALFGSKQAKLDGSDLSGSGALAVLVLAFMAAQGWHKEGKVGKGGLGILRVHDFLESVARMSCHID